MKLIGNQALMGYTATQNSQRGWKEISCSKSMTSGYTTTNTISISIAGGNPEFFFTIYHEYWGGVTDASIHLARGDVYCFGVGTDGNLYQHGAMAAFNYYFYSWNSGIPSPTTNTSNRQLNITSRTQDYGNVRHVHQLYIFSDRIDLITPTCI